MPGSGPHCGRSASAFDITEPQFSHLQSGNNAVTMSRVDKSTSHGKAGKMLSLAPHLVVSEESCYEDERNELCKR